MNLSNYPLSHHHLSLLRKGPKFTPTTFGNPLQNKVDLKEFSRKLIIKELYHDNEMDESLVRNRSNKSFYTTNELINHTVNNIENLNPDTKIPQSNITKEERKALTEMKNNENIIIKRADKGGCLIIMNKDYYRDHLVLACHLNKTEIYQKIDKNQDKSVFQKVKALALKYNEVLTKNEYKYITEFEWSSSPFYVNPKIHKCITLIEKVKTSNTDYIELKNPEDLSSRPIVSSCNSPTSHLSCLIEKLLKPIVPQLTTYIKDDWHFLRILPKNLPFNEITMYSVDITSLYTSITHELGIEAISYWLTKRQDLIPERFSKEFIIESLNLILKNNNFIFDDQLYNQKEGTAMGNKAAPPYACLVMGYLEETKLFPTILPKYFSREQCDQITLYYKRYMDDGFSPLPNNVSIELFINCLNEMHPCIKFTYEKAKLQEQDGKKQQILNFLDVTVILNEDNTIETDIYYKETNAHDYLNFNSEHPHHTKVNVPYNLAKRIIVFVSNPQKMNERLEELKQFLLKCDYPESVINKSFHNAKLQGPAPKPVEKDKILPFVTTHYSNMDHNNMIKEIQSNIDNLSNNTELKEIFNENKVVLSKKQPPNLLRQLTKAEFKTNTTQSRETIGIFKCNRENCKICKIYLQNDIKFQLSSGKFWMVKSHITCKSKNIIYYLKCNGCDETYIGKTINLKSRTNVHITGCRHGNGPNKFDNHVFSCLKDNLVEPYFKLYIMLKFNSPERLLTYEHYLQRSNHDTMNRH